MKFSTGNKALDIFLYVVCCGIIIDGIMGIVLSIKKYRKAKAERKEAEARLKDEEHALIQKFSISVGEMVLEYNKLLEENEDLRLKLLKYEIEQKKGSEDDILTEGRHVINKTNKLIAYLNETPIGEETEDEIYEIMNE